MPAVLARALVTVAALCALAGPAPAESVDVKYHGVVDLKGYDCESITRSSFIHRLCYDNAKRQMIIELGSTYYAYCDIDESSVNDLRAAKSMGEHYNHIIRGRFDCRKTTWLVRYVDASGLLVPRAFQTEEAAVLFIGRIHDDPRQEFRSWAKVETRELPAPPE